MKNEFELAEGLFVLTAGLILFLVLVIGVVLICSATLNRVNKFKTYCDQQFEKITNQIESSNVNTKELTELVKELNSKL